MPKGLFVSHRQYLEPAGGGVQMCTNEYRAVIDAAGIELVTVALDCDRRLGTRLIRRFDSSPYLRPISPSSLDNLIAQVESTPTDFLFLNQVSLAGLAGHIRAHMSPATRIVLLSHGMETTDLFHQVRLRKRLPLSARFRPSPSVTLGKVLLEEAATRRNVDMVVALSPMDAELERWIGTSKVGWLPRVISGDALDWRPDGSRLGWVGTLDHAPNLEGLVLALDRMNSEGPKVRVVGGPPRLGAWLKARYANVDYCGPLDDQSLAREAASWAGFLHPIFCAPRGCSTKLATAIGWRIPIVTTAEGRRGYEWGEGSLIEASGPEDFAGRAASLTDLRFAMVARDEVARVAASSPTAPAVAARLRQMLDLGAA